MRNVTVLVTRDGLVDPLVTKRKSRVEPTTSRKATIFLKRPVLLEANARYKIHLQGVGQTYNGEERSDNIIFMMKGQRTSIQFFDNPNDQNVIDGLWLI